MILKSIKEIIVDLWLSIILEVKNMSQSFSTLEQIRKELHLCCHFKSLEKPGEEGWNSQKWAFLKNAPILTCPGLAAKLGRPSRLVGEPHDWEMPLAENPCKGQVWFKRTYVLMQELTFCGPPVALHWLGQDRSRRRDWPRLPQGGQPGPWRR